MSDDELKQVMEYSEGDLRRAVCTLQSLAPILKSVSCFFYKYCVKIVLYISRAMTMLEIAISVVLRTVYSFQTFANQS